MRRLHVYLAVLALAVGAVLPALVAPAIAAEDGTIAFQGFRRAGGTEPSVFTMAADGSGLQRLGVGEQPAISPDGKKIVFVKTAGENSRFREVFMMDSDGTDVRRLTDDKGFDSQPTISPDGKEIAYVGEGRLGEKPEGAQIFLMTISGSDPVQITRREPGESTSSEPGFSPNGNRIVFVGNGDGGPEIETMSTDGGSRTVLSDRAPVSNPSHPSYAPDGRRIVFQATAKSDGQTNVYTFNPTNGTDLDKVNRGNTTALEPAYSPTGRQIVFRRGVNLFAMTPEGEPSGQLTDLDPVDGSNSQPSWGR